MLQAFKNPGGVGFRSEPKADISCNCQWLLAYHYCHPPSTLGLSNIGLGLYWMGDRSGMSISADSPSDETLNRGPLALLLRRQYEFPFGIYIVQFSIFYFSIVVSF